MSEDPQDPNEPPHEECMIFSADGRTRLLFIEVPEGKQVKNRIHFDLRPTDGTREVEVARLLGLGATEVADHRRPDGSGWVTSPTLRAMSSAYSAVIARSLIRTPT
jgi:hypothetical protein